MIALAGVNETVGPPIQDPTHHPRIKNTMDGLIVLLLDQLGTPIGNQSGGYLLDQRA